MYEFFDHTADLGLRVKASGLDELFADAARGLTAMIAGEAWESLAKPPDELAAHQSIAITADELDNLLRDWLAELLDQFERRHNLFRTFEVTVRHDSGDWRLNATAFGAKVDPQSLALEHEVKAITYHGLQVEETTNGWMAEVVVDI